MKKIFVILLFLTSCGYQPLYLNNNLKKNEFQKIVLKGDNEINRKIVNRLQIKENEFDKELNELLRDLLSSASIKNRGIFSAQSVEKLLMDNHSGKIDASYTILSLLCIEIWCRAYIDK